jgi:hypothetical protein
MHSHFSTKEMILSYKHVKVTLNLPIQTHFIIWRDGDIKLCVDTHVCVGLRYEEKCHQGNLLCIDLVKWLYSIGKDFLNLN